MVKYMKVFVDTWGWISLFNNKEKGIGMSKIGIAPFGQKME